MNCIDVVEQAAFYSFVRALKHHAYSCRRVVAINESMLNQRVRRLPKADRIFSPGVFWIVKAMEVGEGCFVRFNKREALATWVWATHILHSDVVQGSARAVLAPNTLGASFNTHVLKFDVS